MHGKGSKTQTSPGFLAHNADGAHRSGPIHAKGSKTESGAGPMALQEGATKDRRATERRGGAGRAGHPTTAPDDRGRPRAADGRRQRAGDSHVCGAGGAGERGGRWARLKSEERAIEKALRSYKGDVSRVVDICRQPALMHAPRPTHPAQSTHACTPPAACTPPKALVRSVCSGPHTRRR